MRRAVRVYLEVEDLDRLDTYARERGWTRSRALRTAVRMLTGRPEDDDPLLDLSGDLDGLPANLSTCFDRELSKSFALAPAAGRRARRRPRPPGRR